MADSKISALAAASAPLNAAAEIPSNDAGTNEKITIAQLRADMSLNSGWRFLGQATASTAVRTGDVTWTGTFKQLMIEYFISGYSNTAIGRVLVGPTAGISETGTTFCTALLEGTTLNTTSVSAAGWPTAVTVNNVQRHGWMFVKNVAGEVKRMTGHGNHAGTAPTTVPTMMRMDGLFNDTTNLINKARLTVYDVLTGATVSSRTFNAGTYINVWGRNDD